MESRPGDRKPCILHVIPSLGSGGAERQLLTNLSNDAMRSRFRHVVAMTDVANDDPGNPLNHFAPEIRNQGVEIVCLDQPGSFRLPGSIAALRRIIRDREVDLVHTHLLWANIAGRVAGRLSGVPVITSFHNTDYDTAKTRVSMSIRAKAVVIRWLDGVTSRRCLTHSIAVSKTVAAHIQEFLGLKPETISVIYNSFAMEQVSPTCDDPRKKVFDLIGLGAGDRLVLAVGRVFSQKAHIELVKSMGEVVRKHGDVHLAIVGSQVDTGYVAEVRRAIEEQGIGANVHLIQPRHDIPDFLAAADMFAFPSKYEGLGIALIEAMACGLPCISSDIEVLREVVRHDETGLIVPVGDIRAISGAILQLLDDQHLAKRLGSQAKIYAYENFHPDRKAEEMAQLYEQVLHRRR